MTLMAPSYLSNQMEPGPSVTLSGALLDGVLNQPGICTWTSHVVVEI